MVDRVYVRSPHSLFIRSENFPINFPQGGRYLFIRRGEAKGEASGKGSKAVVLLRLDPASRQIALTILVVHTLVATGYCTLISEIIPRRSGYLYWTRRRKAVVFAIWPSYIRTTTWLIYNPNSIVTLQYIIISENFPRRSGLLFKERGEARQWLFTTWPSSNHMGDSPHYEGIGLHHSSLHLRAENFPTRSVLRRLFIGLLFITLLGPQSRCGDN